MGAGKTIALICAIIALGYGVWLLNNSASAIAPPRVPAPSDAKPPAPDHPANAPGAPAQATGNLADQVVEGDPATAKTLITLGYVIDDQVAEKPSTVQTIINYLDASVRNHPDHALVVQNLDIPMDERSNPAIADVPLGLCVNHQPVSGLDTNPGSGTFTFSALQSAVSQIK